MNSLTKNQIINLLHNNIGLVEKIVREYGNCLTDSCEYGLNITKNGNISSGYFSEDLLPYPKDLIRYAMLLIRYAMLIAVQLIDETDIALRDSFFGGYMFLADFVNNKDMKLFKKWENNLNNLKIYLDSKHKNKRDYPNSELNHNEMKRIEKRRKQSLEESVILLTEIKECYYAHFKKAA